ncbi:amidohydrolase family protein [Thiorhodovibrio winogradskyi]|uniref:amidohydrolase family protein n=1 Tax=Thiorhodovibrio winogradskyi TaxID=77007 RepID=UPI002E2E6BD2|nr:amidohydrolase family protein [Thiorhodovibrio winogradskyi]
MSGVETVTIPGLSDFHTHTSLYIALMESTSFWEVSEKEAAMEIIAKLPADDLTLIQGWNESLFSFTEEELASMPPVIIVHYSLHSMVMSPAAEDMLRPDYPDIVARYGDFAWYQRHISDILPFLGRIPKITPEATAAHFEELAAKGVMHVQDMLLVSEDALRIISASPMADRIKFWAGPDMYARLSPGMRAKVWGIKLFTDGGLGTNTAAMHQPYAGEENKGLLVYEDDALLGLMRDTARQELPIALHAVGDRAVTQILDALGALSAEGLGFPEIRVEHAQFISEQQARQLKEAGVVLSMQPNFSLDSTIYAETLPLGYAERNNPFRMLIDQVGYVPGKDLFLSSDGMPHGVEPALESSLFPPHSGQRLALEEFIKGYTRPDEPTRLVVDIDTEQQEVFLKEILSEANADNLD